jgi:hypothetical protein
LQISRNIRIRSLSGNLRQTRQQPLGPQRKDFGTIGKLALTQMQNRVDLFNILKTGGRTGEILSANRNSNEKLGTKVTLGKSNHAHYQSHNPT